MKLLLILKAFAHTIPVTPMLAALLANCQVDVLATPAENARYALTWEVGYSETYIGQPGQWVAAKIPGAVQLDYAKALEYGPYIWAENCKDYAWMEDKYFTYRTSFKKPSSGKKNRVFFVSQGIDYQFDIFLNGNKIFYQEGMFTPIELDLTDHLENDNTLDIKIYPPPEMLGFAAAHPAHTAKPAVSWGWDWHPRLIPVGIWDDTYLEVRNATYLKDVWVDYSLEEPFDRADIRVEVDGVKMAGCLLEWTLTDEEGREIIKTENRAADDLTRLEARLDNPELWWSHDHGNPYLYRSRLRLYGATGKLLETRVSKVGFRKVKMVMAETTWYDPPGFPNTSNVAPFQLEINGRPIFAKGSNWVGPEIFPGIIDRARYEVLVDRAVEANFNILRIWGGGIVKKESFFELCDEKGILVWQEFPLSCYNYVDDPVYLKVLKQESESIIKRVRKHASLALWSGGNELLNTWSGMTEQSLALRLLNSQCLLLDTHTPYINTSPVYGVGHGAYLFIDENGEDVYQRMIRINAMREKFTAYPEFGVPSPSSLEVLRTIIPESELWPPKPGTSWESHHGFKAWGGHPQSWLMVDMIEEFFGKSKDLETMVVNGQILQSEGYKAIFEGARRQKPYCSMALNWCFNEPWPTAANNSLINWPDLPKPAFYAVKDACRPFLASAEITGLVWSAGDEFSTDIWLLNDLSKPPCPANWKSYFVPGMRKYISLHGNSPLQKPIETSGDPQPVPFFRNGRLKKWSCSFRWRGIPNTIHLTR